jgi:TonB family protein
MMKKIFNALGLILLLSYLAFSQEIKDSGKLKGTPRSARIEIAAITAKAGTLSEGTRILSAEYVFDRNGNLTESTAYNFKGAIFAKFIAIYDEKGNKKEETYYSPKGKLLDKMTYNYDSRGQLSESLIQTNKTSSIASVKFNYDSNGKIIETNHTSSKEKKGYQITYSYDESARRIERISYDVSKEMTVKTVMTYDVQGRLQVLENQPVQPSTTGWRLELSYDNNGNVAEETFRIQNNMSRWRYQYELDQKGNWIKRTKLALVNNKGALAFEAVERTYRTITYHETTEASVGELSLSLSSIVTKDETRSILSEEAIKRYEPTYPEQAKQKRIGGQVTVSVLIDEKGKVITAKALTTTSELLINAAEGAAWHWKFNPVLSGGYVVRYVGPIIFNFNL